MSVAKTLRKTQKTTRSLPFFLRVAATGTTARNTSLLIDSVCNGDAKAHRNGARLPSLTGIATQLSFSQEILCTLADTVVYWKWGLLRNQSKRRWCYYSTALTLPHTIFQILKNYIIKQLQPENVKSAQFFITYPENKNFPRVKQFKNGFPWILPAHSVGSWCSSWNIWKGYQESPSSSVRPSGALSLMLTSTG